MIHITTLITREESSSQGKPATNLVVLQNFLYGLTSIWEMLLFKTFNYTFSFFTDEFKCKHIMSFNLIIYNLKAKVQKIFVITQKNADFFAEKGRNKVF